MRRSSNNANDVIRNGFQAADASDRNLKWRRQTWKVFFVSFKVHCDDTWKISRKRHLLEIEDKEIYPPEGYLAFHALEQSDSRTGPSDSCNSDDEDCDVESHQDEAEQNVDFVHSVY